MKITSRGCLAVNLFDNLNPIGRIAVLLLVLSAPGISSVASADSFDAPLKKKVVHFGLSPYYPGGNVRIRLSCYFYPAFMVKEYDEGQKGAEWLTILAIEKGAGPACTRSHALGERIIEGAGWSGYFKGAKGNLVFLGAADGTDGGIPFAIYDSRTGTKIFEDSAYESSIWNQKVKDSPFNHIRVSTAPSGKFSLSYLRVVQADCDLYREKVACWEQVRKKFELKSAQMPVCSGYKDISDRWVSALAYPVTVFLFPEPVIKTISGPVKCWPVD